MKAVLFALYQAANNVATLSSITHRAAAPTAVTVMVDGHLASRP